MHTQLQVTNSNGYTCLKASNWLYLFSVAVFYIYFNCSLLSEQMEIMSSVELGRLGEKSGFESS